MDWGKVLGAANVGISLMNSLALDDLREQGERAIAEQRLQELLRNRIFSLRQSAETVLSATDALPKQQAAAMKILELQVSDAILKPENFRELSDKEYVHATGKLIREAAAVLYTQLSESEQTEVTEIIAVYNRLPEYDVYLSQYSTQRQLQEAKEIVAQYEGRQLHGCGGVFLIFLPLFLAVGLFSALGADGPAAAGLGVLLYLVILPIYYSWAHTREYKESLQVVSELVEAEKNASNFRRLQRKFGDDTKARSMKKTDEVLIRAFFGGSTMVLN